MTFIFTHALHARAEMEGWGIFNDAEVQRLDDDDAGRGFVLRMTQRPSCWREPLACL